MPDASPFKIAADVVEVWNAVRRDNANVFVNVHGVVEQANRTAHGQTRHCGYYHREDLVNAAAFMLEAIKRLDDSEDPAHDCR